MPGVGRDSPVVACRRSSRRRCASWGWPAPRAAHRRAARPAACPPTSGASTPRAARSAPSAHLPKLRVAADWRAPIERNLLRGALDAGRGRGRRPAAAPRVLGQHPAPRRAGHELPRARDATALWKQALRDGHADAATARAVGAMLARIHATRPRARRSRPQFATDAIFFDIRLEPYLLATARAPSGPGAGARARWCGRPQREAVALVHGDVSPKNILVGAERAGAARRRVRLVGRPGLRPRLLPQPPAAEVPVDAGGDAPAFLAASRPCPKPTSSASTGSRADGARAARRGAAAGPVAGARRRQVAGRVPRRRGRPRTRCAASPARLLARSCRSPRHRSPPPGARSSPHECHNDIRAIHARRVWDSRGRPTVEAELTLHDGAVGRAIVPGRRLQGHARSARAARRRRARFGGLDVHAARSPTSTARSRARCVGAGGRRPGRARPRA